MCELWRSTCPKKNGGEIQNNANESAVENGMHPHVRLYLREKLLKAKEQLQNVRSALEVEGKLLKTLDTIERAEHARLVAVETDRRDRLQKELDSQTDIYQNKSARMERERTELNFSKEDLQVERIALRKKRDELSAKRDRLFSEMEALSKTRDQWKQMKDLSQLPPRAQQFVLRYLDPLSFARVLNVCKAWNWSLSKPQNWLWVQRRNFRDEFHIPPQPPQVRVEPIPKSTISMKMDPVKSRGFLKKKQEIQIDKEDMYRTCMETVQKKLAQASQDSEDVQDRVNADDELIKFLEKGMHEKMTKHGELAVKSFNLRQSLSDSATSKRSMSNKISELDVQIESEKKLITTLKVQAHNAEAQRQKNLKLQTDLISASSDDVEADLEKLREHKKKLVKALIQLRGQTKKRTQEHEKFEERIKVLKQKQSSDNRSDTSDLP